MNLDYTFKEIVSKYNITFASNYDHSYGSLIKKIGT